MLNIMHRDIKPDNILLSPNGDVALTDFNCAFCYNLKIPYKSCLTYDSAGTARYMAPECFEHDSSSSWSSDIWSLGLVILDMFRDRIEVRIFTTSKAQFLIFSFVMT